MDYQCEEHTNGATGTRHKTSSGEIERTYVQGSYNRVARIFYTTWHPVPIWYFDLAMGPPHPAPCSHLVVQKYNQPSAGSTGGPPGTLIPFGTMLYVPGRPYTSTTTPPPALRTAVLILRANLKSHSSTVPSAQARHV